ncbi:ABC transporter ATP-binding protein [Sinorhizobium medicae]|uniref:ABC transporter ATP-binding protein n=1 Tax=Sinorhizobium medicae TaxID=110321 RepID=UPI000FDBB908|nr:ABC transporter ATP-binding protein [Sinorhizobium medicae]RVO73531.1 ABC transporter ATP-binding protein [Sinorhizobium medicae]
MNDSSNVLEINGVSKRFGGLLAVSDVSFNVQEKKVVCVIGPNGAGKTTLFNLLTGQLAPTTGEVRFAGRQVNNDPPHRRARLGMGRTFQIAKPLMGLSVIENVMVASFLKHPHRHDAEIKAIQVLQEVGLLPLALRQVSSLTLSQHRRLEVARALALDPKVILLDEVMAGLNPSEIGQAIDLYGDLNSRGLTFLIIEHNLKVVRAFAEHVVVLDHGVKIAEGSANDVLSSSAVIEAYIGRKEA